MQAESRSQVRGAGRRKWSLEERGAIVRASLKKGTTVDTVAQLYGVNPSQIYDWRKQAREAAQQKKLTALVPVEVVEEVSVAGIETKQSCSVVIEARSSRITITGHMDATIVRMILECLAR